MAKLLMLHHASWYARTLGACWKLKTIWDLLALFWESLTLCLPRVLILLLTIYSTTFEASKTNLKVIKKLQTAKGIKEFSNKKKKFNKKSSFSKLDSLAEVFLSLSLTLPFLMNVQRRLNCATLLHTPELRSKFAACSIPRSEVHLRVLKQKHFSKIKRRSTSDIEKCVRENIIRFDIRD